MKKLHPIKRTAAALASTAVLAVGLMSAGSAMATNVFDAKMAAAIAHVKADPNYKAIPMKSSAERAWFYQESQSLWEKKITKEQYVAEGAKQFPGYEASLSEFADQLVQS